MRICFVRCRDGTELSIFVLICTFLDSTLFDLTAFVLLYVI